MSKKIFFNSIFLLYCSLFIYGQTNNTSINNTENCIKIWRTTDNADALITFSVDKFTIAPNTTRYIQMMVNYNTQPDIAIQIANENENSDTTFSSLIRPTEKYTNFGTWQTIVFPISAQANEIDVNTILIFPDLGIENEPTGQILNNFGKVGYIDEIILLENTTLSTDTAIYNNSISIQPNPVENILKIATERILINVSFYDSLGKEIIKNINKININEYDVSSSLSTGLYFIKCVDENNVVETLKVIKQ